MREESLMHAHFPRLRRRIEAQAIASIPPGGRLPKRLRAKQYGSSQDTEIVITSSWREAFSLERMRSLFSPDIAARIIGVTPIDGRREDHYRYREVLAYMKRSGKSGVPWVALDDDSSHYPPFANLILIDGERGFDSLAAECLVRMAQPGH